MEPVSRAPRFGLCPCLRPSFPKAHQPVFQHDGISINLCIAISVSAVQYFVSCGRHLYLFCPGQCTGFTIFFASLTFPSLPFPICALGLHLYTCMSASAVPNLHPRVYCMWQAIVCDEYFVPALTRMCHKMQISDDVAG